MSGMRSALDEFRNDIGNSTYEVVIITESWLQNQHLNQEIVPQGWSIFRKDRFKAGNRNDILGGGVFIAVNDSIACTEVSLSYDDDEVFDIAACKLTLSEKSIYICSFYIPPLSSCYINGSIRY